MNKKELEALADKHQRKAEEAYRNYQETGISRYNRERQKNEDFADAFRMAAAASEEHHALIHLRGSVAALASEAKHIEFVPDDQKPKALEALRKNLIASANLAGVHTV